MRQLLAIARREIGAFFRSAMAPVVVTCFLLLTGLFFTLIVFGYSQLSAEAQRSGRLAEVVLNLADGVFQPLAVNISVFLIFLLPAVTMRLFAEEYRSGRYDLIMSWPVADHVWVLGKFAAAVAVMLTLVAGASAHIAAAAALGRIEIGPLLAAGLGLLLAATLNAAWGVFFSTLLPYQVVAYILTFGFLLLLHAIGGLEPHLPGALGRLASQSVPSRALPPFLARHHRQPGLYYFLAWTGLGLAAAAASLGGRRLAGAGRLARWSPVVVSAALLLVVGALVERHAWSADLTSNRRFSPAPQTVRIMQYLRSEVHVYAFYQRLDPRRAAAEVLLSAFADRSGRFRYEFIDPDRDLALVERYRVTTGGTVIVEVEGRQRTLLQPRRGVPRQRDLPPGHRHAAGHLLRGRTRRAPARQRRSQRLQRSGAGRCSRRATNCASCCWSTSRWCPPTRRRSCWRPPRPICRRPNWRRCAAMSVTADRAWRCWIPARRPAWPPGSPGTT